MTLPRRLATLLLTLALVAGLPPAARAQGHGRPPAHAAKAAAGPVNDYTSRHFIIHTDLPAEKAKEILQKLETMLRLISAYWGRPLSGIIECNVVDDLNKWSGRPFDPRGLSSIQAGGGVTVAHKLTAGNQFLTKVAVYAVSTPGVVQHEVVHAYCQHTFGTVGPIWYAEGMAEMGQYWHEEDKAVHIHAPVLRYLQESPPKSIRELIDPQQYTGDSWQNYAWRWALCHLLSNNPNYAPRFRPLGLAMLTGQNASFEQVYGPMAQEISFEYLFFLKHIDNGLRVDLCAWNWKKKFATLGPSAAAVAVHVQANRGWQPSGVTVAEGTAYEYTATGAWQTDKSDPAVSADGAADGRGRLVGVLMKDFQLGEPFPLGATGTFKPPAAGNLYLRCQDHWNRLAEHSGTVVVKIKRKGA